MNVDFRPERSASSRPAGAVGHADTALGKLLGQICHIPAPFTKLFLVRRTGAVAQQVLPPPSPKPNPGEFCSPVMFCGDSNSSVFILVFPRLQRAGSSVFMVPELFGQVIRFLE